MATYQHPGVYIEELPSSSKPIEGVATSITAFVGSAARGPVGEANLISKIDDYTNEYGDILSEDDAMGLAIQAFYLNGGKSAYVCRLAGDGSASADSDSNGEGDGSIVTPNPVLNIAAKSVGGWGNKLYYRIVKSNPSSLTFDLEIGCQADGKFKEYESFTGLSMRDDENYAITQVNTNSSIVTLTAGDAAEIDGASSLYQKAVVTGGEITDTVSTYFSSRVTAGMTLTLNINGSGAEQISISPDLTSGVHNTNGKAVASAIVAAVNALSTDDAHQDFTCDYTSHKFVLESTIDGSLASLQIYDGDLAEILRLDSTQAAVLTGASVSGTVFNTAIASDVDLTVNVDSLGDQVLTLVQADIGLEGIDNTVDGEALALYIQNAVRAIDNSLPSYKGFTCSFASDVFTMTSGSADVRTTSIVVSAGSLQPTIGMDAGTTLVAGRQIEQGSAQVIPVEILGLNNEGVNLSGGGENSPTAADYSDFYSTVLRKVKDASILVLPGEYWASDGSGNAIVSQTLSHCESMKNRMLLVDPPPAVEFEQATAVDQMALPTSTYSTLYYPWVDVANPLYNEETNPNVDSTVSVAPSAFAAGMWAKIDSRRGVWKAPAGVETQLLGAAGLEFTVEEAEQDQLNPLGVNCIRKLPGYGRVFWGTRTLSTKANPEWRYVPVRRTAIYIEQSIYNGTQWVVFEPNNGPLWSSLKANIGSFMNGMFRSGAFQGKTADEAYFVRCGLGDTMTQADIDRGHVIVQVGFAPVKPAEFVIVRIQQKIGQQ